MSALAAETGKQSPALQAMLDCLLAADILAREVSMMFEVRCNQVLADAAIEAVFRACGAYVVRKQRMLDLLELPDRRDIAG